MNEGKFGPVTRCTNCGSKDLRKFLSLGNQPAPMQFPKSLEEPETSWPLDILFCPDCKLVQQGYIVDPQLLFGEYQYTSSATKSFAEHLDRLADMIVNRYNPNYEIDIGCSDGTLLKSFKDRGVNVFGIEPSTTSAITKERGIPVMRDFFNQHTALKILSETSWHKADTITATNVFAHVAELDSFVRGVYRLLKDDGVFVTESTYLFDMIQKLEYDVCYHEHIRSYSLHSIIDVLARRGFEVFDAERIPPFGGSIRVFARKKITETPLGSRVEEILELEDHIGLDDYRTYTRFAEKVRESKVKLNALIYRLKSEGARIVGLGAPARASTLLGYCALGPDVLDYVAETAALKIGRYIPRVRILVRSEDNILFNPQPDYLLLLSWHLSDILIPKLRQNGYEGKFIIPLPEPRIV